MSTVNSTIAFDGGSIHIINSFLAPPVNVSSSAVALNLTSAVGAIIAANLTEAVDTTPDLTVFVPNNAAFRRVASALMNASASDLVSVLQYHVVPGVLYSTGISNTSLTTLQGTNVTTRVTNGTVYVNDARVILPNVLTSNGVIHVIDSVLNPQNTTANGTSSEADAFGGASSASGDVFTSGVPTPTSSINTAVASPTGGSSSSSSGLAAIKAIETGAVAVAALFGAVMNL